MGKKLKNSILIVVIIAVLIGLSYQVISSRKKVVLELGIFSGSLYDVPSMQSYKMIDDAITRFQMYNPKIMIKYKYGILKSDYSEWIAGRALKGDMPDVMVILQEDFNIFSTVGILKKLDKLIKNDKDFHTRKIYKNAMRSGSFEGRQYALPMEVDPILLFVNKTLLKKEGIKLPEKNWTWEEFYEICQKVTKDTDGDGELDQFGFVDFSWEHAVYTNGQELFTKDGKKGLFSEPEVVKTIEFVNKLETLNQNHKVSIEDFNSGRVAFKPFPFSWYKVYKSYPYRIIRYADFDWECITLPRGPRGKNASRLNSFLLGIGSRTKHEEEAWKFLKFLVYDPETQMNVLKYSHGVPVLRDVTESERADEEIRRYNIKEKVSVDRKLLSDVIEKSVVIHRFHKREKAMKMADQEIYRIIVDDTDVKDSLEKLNKEINEFLKN